LLEVKHQEICYEEEREAQDKEEEDRDGRRHGEGRKWMMRACEESTVAGPYIKMTTAAS